MSQSAIKPIQILFFCPRWGHAHLSWEELAAKAKNSGYDGLETDIPETKTGIAELQQALSKYDLRLVAQHWETVDPDFDQHKKAYEKRLRHMASALPFFINAQTGRDFFSFQQNQELLAVAGQVSKETGVPVFHETHRGKFSFAAHITAEFIRKISYLQLTLDISHWINVAETFLEEQSAAVDLAILRTRHIHARVGHTQGSQITDPRKPEWKQAVEVHLGYWDKIIDSSIKAGNEWIGITPEFGPLPYMPLHPETGNPVTDQWEVNVYMMELLRKRYNT